MIYSEKPCLGWDTSWKFLYVPTAKGINLQHMLEGNYSHLERPANSQDPRTGLLSYGLNSEEVLS